MSDIWITLSDGEVMPASNGERMSVAAAKGNDDLPVIVGQVVAMFREAIASRGNALGPDGTFPAGFKTYAVSLALWLFITTGVARNDGVHTKEREKAAERAEDFLQLIRDGKVSVPLPDGVTAGAARAGTWNSENKLLPRTHPVPPPATQFQSTSGTNRPYANPDANAIQDS